MPRLATEPARRCHVCAMGLLYQSYALYALYIKADYMLNALETWFWSANFPFADACSCFTATAIEITVQQLGLLFAQRWLSPHTPPPIAALPASQLFSFQKSSRIVCIACYDLCMVRRVILLKKNLVQHPRSTLGAVKARIYRKKWLVNRNILPICNVAIRYEALSNLSESYSHSMQTESKTTSHLHFPLL